MKPFLFFVICFTFSFSNLWGQSFTKDEVKQAWTNTGYDFKTLAQLLEPSYCYESEKTFTSCLMAFHRLFSTAMEEEPHQLKVSDLNKLEIVPFSRPDNPTAKEYLALQAERRESFRRFFKTQANVEQELNRITQQIFEFAKKIPQTDRSKLAADTYNAFLGELYDPNSYMFPMELKATTISKSSGKNLFGIGAHLKIYKTEDGRTTMAVYPFEASPSKAAGFKKGDLILSVDDFGIGGLPANTTQTQEDIISRIKDQEGTQVKFNVLSVCNNQEKEIVVTRGPVRSPIFHWLAEMNNYFVNLTREEALDCEPRKASTEGGTEEGLDVRQAALTEKDTDTASESDFDEPPQALYMSLKSFEPYQSNPVTASLIRSLLPVMPMIGEFPVCAEFMALQAKDLDNPQSQGMILDLRGNTGGSLHEVSCMLNTIIHDNGGIIARYLPFEEGQIKRSKATSKDQAYLFTNEGFPLSLKNRLPNFMTYNRNIVVIVDRASSSSSEVFAGTIQDMKRGWVIGDRTLGKGSAQEASIIHLPPDPDKGGNEPQPIELKITTGIFTLNSGRSPHRHGIIPGFRFSTTGEPIENETNYISFYASFADQVFFNNIQFENVPWKQNRPEELAQLKECVNTEGRMGKALKEKIQEDKKYGRPFARDYYLELAKDILMCSKPRSDYKLSPNVSLPYGRGQTDSD